MNVINCFYSDIAHVLSFVPGHIYLFRLREMGPKEEGGFHVRIQVPGRP